MDPLRFEAGYEPVVIVDGHGAVGTRSGAGGHAPVVRIEFLDGRALHFDGAGRLIHAHENGVAYRRTLDDRLLVSQVVGAGEERRLRREPPSVEPLERLIAWHRSVRALRERAPGARALRGAVADPAAWLRTTLEPSASWTAEGLELDRRRLHAIYRPIPVLPPDQYLALVLQATEGCAYNRCGFCTFYRDTPHRVKGVEEFAAHADAVLDHLGRTAERFHRLFLGQANALLAGGERLLAMLDRIRDRLPLRPESLDPAERRRWAAQRPLWIDGVYSFVDAFHELPSPATLRALRRRGLRRVYVGLETGSPGLLRLLGKPGPPDEVVELARSLRAADVHLGVILLVGAGGREHATEHLRASLELLRSLQLRRGDQVYLSRLVTHEGSDYARRVERDGLTPLDPEQLVEQVEEFRRGALSVARGVPVALYDVGLSRNPTAFGG